MLSSRRQVGFTIVELLIVVVVIAVLAAITIVAYNGITQRAQEAAISSGFRTAHTKIEQLKVLNAVGTYPQVPQDVLSSLGTNSSIGYKSFMAGTDYCVTMVKNGKLYHSLGVDKKQRLGGCFMDCSGTVYTFCSRNSVTSAVARDAQGNYYTLNYGSYAFRTAIDYNLDLVKFDSSHNVIWVKSGGGTADGMIESASYRPWGVFVDPQDNIWVADSGNHRIQKFDQSGNFILKLGGLAAGAATDQFDTPYGMAFTNDGHVWIADRYNHRMKKYTLDGTLVTVRGNTDGMVLNQPHGVYIDAAQNIYVASRNNFRIQKYNSSGVLQATIGAGTAGTADGQIDQPTTVLVDPSNGDIYTYEIVNKRISVFAANGTFIRHFSTVSLSPEMNNHRAFSMIWDGNNITLAVQSAGDVRIQTITKTGALVEVLRGDVIKP